MKRILVIGNGAAAAATVYNLCRQSKDKIEITVVGESSSLGAGMAYGTIYREHLLNVPVGKISAAADNSDHFFDWLNSNKASIAPELRSFDRTSFMPRSVYAKYLGALVRDTLTESTHASFQEKRARALGAEENSGALSVLCSDGQTLHCDHLVLAMGNRPPRFPGKHSSMSFPSAVSNPWDKSADFSELQNSDTVVLLGTGLTAVDVLTRLRTEGFMGTVIMLSRHGLLPQPHQAHDAVAIDWANSGHTPRELLRTFKQALLSGSNWRGTIDSLRPHTQRLWLGFSNWQKRQFLRHLRTIWDTHRHRMAGSVASFMQNELESGNTSIVSGQLASVTESADTLDVQFKSKVGKSLDTICARLLVNCTGSDFDWRDDTLTSSLFHGGLAQPGSLGLGLLCNESGEILDCSNQPSKNIHAIGSLLAGTLWESTAMPEIRIQARQCAERITKS
jgi:uncharacterized NAD(P)/FAD-binding protein YdhS